MRREKKILRKNRISDRWFPMTFGWTRDAACRPPRLIRAESRVFSESRRKRAAACASRAAPRSQAFDRPLRAIQFVAEIRPSVFADPGANHELCSSALKSLERLQKARGAASEGRFRASTPRHGLAPLGDGPNRARSSVRPMAASLRSPGPPRRPLAGSESARSRDSDRTQPPAAAACVDATTAPACRDRRPRAGGRRSLA